MLVLDHLAVAGETLDDARAHVEEALGVALLPGGQHPRFGTHNMVLGLADGLYLEAIAVDQTAAPPVDARWFGLDDFAGPPRLSNWICRCDDLSRALNALPEAGRAVALSRGGLRWRMAVPENGHLPHDNRFPAVIQWLTRPTPAEALPVSGCRLMRLVVSHPQARLLEAMLAPWFADPRVAFEEGASALQASFETPSGTRYLA